MLADSGGRPKALLLPNTLNVFGDTGVLGAQPIRSLLRDFRVLVNTKVLRRPRTTLPCAAVNRSDKHGQAATSETALDRLAVGLAGLRELR